MRFLFAKNLARRKRCRFFRPAEKGVTTGRYAKKWARRNDTTYWMVH
jgi:hypothetical protein